jgi:hypothetical protein
MMRSARIALYLIWILALVARPIPVRAEPRIVEASMDFVFGEQVTFYARVESDIPVTGGTVFFQASNETQTSLGEMLVDSSDDDTYELSYVHHIADYALPAFTEIEYRYDIVLENGDTISTKWYSEYYYDDRYTWQQLVEDPFHVYWYEGDLVFAQEVLDTVQESLIKIQNVLPLPVPDPLKIYIYPDARAMQTTLNPASAGWVAGHADPELGVVVVALPGGPDQYLLMQQRIPHEIMHIVLFEATNLGYDNLPTWLSEGLASMVELYPNPDYPVVLKNAVEKESLLPMATLCKGFPRDASTALLAYAQSASFTQYLYNRYGTTGLEQLVTNYANGLDCEHGAKAALGKDLSRLDRAWRGEILNENLALTAFKNLLPWLVFLVIALGAPLGLAVYGLRARRVKAQPRHAPRDTAA